MLLAVNGVQFRASLIYQTSDIRNRCPLSLKRPHESQVFISSYIQIIALLETFYFGGLQSWIPKFKAPVVYRNAEVAEGGGWIRWIPNPESHTRTHSFLCYLEEINFILPIKDSGCLELIPRGEDLGMIWARLDFELRSD